LTQHKTQHDTAANMKDDTMGQNHWARHDTMWHDCQHKTWHVMTWLPT